MCKRVLKSGRVGKKLVTRRSEDEGGEGAGDAVVRERGDGRRE